jgi:hypothetical protein
MVRSLCGTCSILPIVASRFSLCVGKAPLVLKSLYEDLSVLAQLIGVVNL